MSDQQENSNPRPNKRFHHNRNKRVKAIQATALNPTLPNGVKKELTFHQALSILLRSRQLIREGAFHPHLISAADKKAQIEECYKQRDAQRQ